MGEARKSLKLHLCNQLTPMQVSQSLNGAKASALKHSKRSDILLTLNGLVLLFVLWATSESWMRSLPGVI
jgi:hypothetical protein